MRGYSGSDSLFRLFMSQLRKQHQSAGTASALALDASGAYVQIPADAKPVPTPKGRLSPTRASWLCGGQPDKLDEKQRKLVEQIRATHRDLDSAYQLSQAFVTMPSRTPGPGSGRLAHQSQTERYSRTEELCGGASVAITLSCAPLSLLAFRQGQVEAQVNWRTAAKTDRVREGQLRLDSGFAFSVAFRGTLILMGSLLLAHIR